MGGYVGIPTSYTPVEYIESTGTQYIDTGIVPVSTSRFVADMSLTDLTMTNRCGWGSSGGQECIGFGLGDGATSTFFGVCASTNNYIQMSSKDTNRHIFDVSNAGIKLDGTSYANGNIGNTAEAGQTIYLFGYHAEWGSTGVQLAKHKVYSSQIYDGDTLVRDFIPVIDQDNTACLYEQVEGKLYYNKGTGSFTAGSATGQAVLLGSKARKIKKGYVGVPASYIPVEYIESTGTQYIDTGVVRDIIKKFRFVASVKWSDIQTRQCIGAQGYVYFGVSGGKYQIAQGGTATTNINATTGSFENIDLTFNCPSSTCTGTVNNTSTGTISVTYLNTPENAHIHLFSLNDLVLPCSVQIASFQIYENDVLVRNFIPVLDDNNVACMYELIEGRFYYNKGTGSFTAGSTTGQPVSIGNVARKIKKGYVGVSTSYTPVDYIQSSGTQYIDTGVEGIYTSVRFEMEYTLDTFLTNTEQTFVGNKNPSTSQGTTIFASSSGNANLGGWSGSGTTEIIGTMTAGAINVLDLTFTAPSGRSGTFNGTSYTSTASNNITNQTDTFAIFSAKSTTCETPASSKLYYLKITIDNVLVRNFIPVVDQDNVACLYEQVEGKLYYNQGAGTFTAGSTTGQEVALNPVARLCYSASALPDTALFLCHLDNNTINEITGNNTAPHSSSVTSYSTGKFGQAATIRATQVVSDYAATTNIFSLSDTNLPNAYNVLSGNASPVTATGWFKASTNDGWIFAYGYGDFKTWGKNGAASYRNGIGVDASGGYLRAKIVYRTSSSPLNTASVTTDVASSVYADGNWHHYAIEVDSTGMNFYFDGVYKCHINKPSNIMSDGFSKRVHFALGDEVMVCGELLYNHRNFTPPDRPYTI